MSDSKGFYAIAMKYKHPLFTKGEWIVDEDPGPIENLCWIAAAMNENGEHNLYFLTGLGAVYSTTPDGFRPATAAERASAAAGGFREPSGHVWRLPADDPGWLRGDE